MNILLICEHLDGADGWSRYSANLADALRNRRHDVRVHCVGGAGHRTLFWCAGSALTFLTRPWERFLLARTIRRLWQLHHPDILHILVEPYALAVPFLPQRIVGRTVLTIHGSYGIRPLRWWLSRRGALRSYARIPRFIAVGKYTKAAVTKELERIGFRDLAQRVRERTSVIPNGIPIPPHQPFDGVYPERSRGAQDGAGQAPRKRTDNATHKRILHIGGIKKSKGLRETIEACAIFRKRSKTPFTLSIAGERMDTAFAREIDECIRKHALEEHVVFCGRLSDEELSEAYRRADLLLVPSHTTETSFEGFGFVYIEANAHGVPVIGPDAGGAAEVISDGGSGYRVNVHDPGQIAQRMERVLDEGRIDPERCRQWALHYDISTMAKNVEALYRELLHPDSHDN